VFCQVLLLILKELYIVDGQLHIVDDTHHLQLDSPLFVILSLLMSPETVEN